MIDKAFAGGQRWISENEPELGLGTVFSCDSRRVTLLFQASGEVRHYPRADAPLRRVRFRPGQFVHSYEGWSLQVEMVEEDGGVLVYRGEGRRLPETELAEQSGYRGAVARLLNGPRDSSDWFVLRLESLHHRQWWEGSPLRGLAGARVPLRAGLLHLAGEVNERAEPRVLIGDETATELIPEMGSILHQRLCRQRDTRVLVLTRQASLQRWNRAMLARFQLPFEILDQTHWQVLEKAGEDDPWAVEPLVLVALEWLLAQPRQQLALLAQDWQLLVVDEVQQLDWQTERPGTDYLLVAELCERIPGVVLLATGGRGSADPFPYLHLLDPVVFSGPAARQEQIERDRRLLRLARAVGAGLAPSADDLAVLGAWPEAAELSELLHRAVTEARLRDDCLQALAWRHSTAGLVFEGIRTAFATSPRQLRAVALPCPPEYREHAALPCPERGYRGTAPWWQIDPRVRWLIEQLPSLGRILVLCSHAASGRELYTALERAGFDAACLHEYQTPLGRDRAVEGFLAAGEPVVLICSERGVEGRELPAVSRLLLFDLPPEPLRLARCLAGLASVGGEQPLTVHMAYLQDTAQAVLHRWYQEGLGGLENALAPLVPTLELEARLGTAMAGGEMAPLLALSRQLREQELSRREAARATLGTPTDWRLDTPSVDLLAALTTLEQDTRLVDYLDRLLGLHGVLGEPVGEGLKRLTPGEHAPGGFPGVPDTGTLVSFERARVLVREELAFLNWDHPLVSEAMSQLLAGERGNACVVAWNDPAGTPELLLEAIYVVEAPLSGARIEEFLPPTPLRVVVDAEFAEVSETYSHESINHRTVALEDGAIRALLSHHRELLEALLEVAEINAQMHQHDLLDSAHRRAVAALENHCRELEARRRLNPAVRAGELTAARERLERLDGILSDASLRLDALRLVVGQG